ncbi:protein kinase-like protein [Niveomyces insectorum RCEF 264]|uniref:non-specific serine/threonine protein kinase n=1 Tax=Niveomyces insectorum RCEF 264 TaxID=1081102 RepID=A0A167LSP7_9HYPO|nr:protein kinase-like protein [Niveomyces insectorum RCEF 264]
MARRLATPLQPREFPTTGFEVIDPADKVEEEQLPSYQPTAYYPMRIGEVVRNRYQVVAKLGYGVTSTVWLARDLRDGTYWTLKVHINTLEHNQELVIFRHLIDYAATLRASAAKSANRSTEGNEYLGRDYVRTLHDSFRLTGPHGEHDVFVLTPLGMSVRTLQETQKSGVFPQTFVTGAIDQLLLGLVYLHEADVVHTDIHSDNLLISLVDNSILAAIEEDEMKTPVARKRVDDDSFVYVSRYMLGGKGHLVICDFGQARIGGRHTASAMPVPYRAPEILLHLPWGHAVDMWSVGLLASYFSSAFSFSASFSSFLTERCPLTVLQAWDLLERESLFRVYDADSEATNTAHHLAAMTALLGPPPPEFLSKSPETEKYWDAEGRWHGPVPLPPSRNFASRITTLTGDDKENCVFFLECCLSWLPEERLPPLKAYVLPWLRGGTMEDCLARMGLS